MRLRLPYSDWLWPQPGYYTDIAETLAVENGTTHDAPFFWAHQFSFQQGTCRGTTYPCQGYVGLQGGRGAKLAIFSIWDANGAKGANCGRFNDEGSGYSCRLAPYDWQYDRDYVLRVKVDGSGSKGVWFKATVTDSVTRVERTIGRIRVPHGRGGIQGWTSWTEYMGPDPANCASFPRSVARWTFPVANNGRTATTSQMSETGAGDCASQIQQVAGGQRQVAPK